MNSVVTAFWSIPEGVAVSDEVILLKKYKKVYGQDSIYWLYKSSLFTKQKIEFRKTKD